MRDNIHDSQFLGHIGGDDFVIIIDNHVEEDYFDKIKSDFEKKVLNYYDPTDLEKGYVETYSREGNLKKYPLITVTIVAFNNKSNNFTSIYELTKFLAKGKGDKKSQVKIL